jgi:hypothetical protein
MLGRAAMHPQDACLGWLPYSYTVTQQVKGNIHLLSLCDGVLMNAAFLIGDTFLSGFKLDLQV